MCHWYPLDVAQPVICPVPWSHEGPSVTIENLVKRPHVFNLPAAIMGPAFGVRKLCGARRYKGKPGEPRVRGGYKRLSESLTVRPKGKDGDTVVALPPAVRRCPEVETAVARGWIKLIKVKPGETGKLVEKVKAAAVAKKAATKQETERLKAKRAVKAEQLTKLLPSAPKTTRKPTRRRAADPKEEG